MLFDPHVDTIDDVLAIRAKCREILLAGGTEITNWQSENTTVTKTRGISLQKLMDETLAYLRLVDPETYGRACKRSMPFYY
jgi:hypothetical protein